MAFSEDLVHWTRCTDNPVPRVDRTAWDERFVSDPCIVKDGSLWINYYFGYGKIYEDGHTHAQEGSGSFNGSDPLGKVREPILPNGAPGSIDSGHAHKASVVYYEGVLYHLLCHTSLDGRRSHAGLRRIPHYLRGRERTGLGERRDDSIWNDWMHCCGEKPPAIYSLFSG